MKKIITILMLILSTLSFYLLLLKNYMWEQMLNLNLMNILKIIKW